MMLGILLTLLMLAVMMILLRPMLTASPTANVEGPELERAVYRDQLVELQRDAERGLIGPEEAKAASNEISRRLLRTAATGLVPATTGSAREWAAALLVIPAIAVPLYLTNGNPRMPDVPLAERLSLAAQNRDVPALVRQVERQLEKTPNDLRGWQTLLPVYRTERRWADAANAYANIVRLAEPNSDLMVEYANALMMANGGEIASDSHAALQEALKLDPKNPKARFFDALAYKQQGKGDEARSRLQALLADAPTDAPYRRAVEAELASLTVSKAPALTDEQLAAASGMSGGDKAAMIGSMIDRLEKRLGTTSTDIEGWLRLIRARGVNGEPDKARQSLATARAILKNNPQALASLASLAAELKLDP
jgi:cytochrome c-type biogenesis protein CcmH